MNEDDDYIEVEETEKGSNKPLYILLGVIFLPALIVAFLMYKVLLKVKRQKRSMVLLYASIMLAVTVGLALIFDVWGTFSTNVMNFMQLHHNWTSLLPFIIVVNVVLGIIFGVVIIFVQISRMIKNPHLTSLQGSWMYKFNFKPTIFELWRKKRVVEKLKSGELAEIDRAPLGLDETVYDGLQMKHDFNVAYRYDSEARKHCLISGAPGSGKAIDLEMSVLTPNGFVKNKYLNLGDEIVGMDGQIARIISFSEVETKDEYLVHCEGSIGVKGVSPDHLWLVWGEKAHEFETNKGEVKGTNRTLKEKVKQALKGDKLSNYTTIGMLVSLLQLDEKEAGLLSVISKRFVPFTKVEVFEMTDFYDSRLLLESLLTVISFSEKGNENIDILPEVINTEELAKRLNEGERIYLPTMSALNTGEGIDEQQFENLLSDALLLNRKFVKSDFYRLSKLQRRELLVFITEKFGKSDDKGRFAFNLKKERQAVKLRELISLCGYKAEFGSRWVSFAPETDFIVGFTNDKFAVKNSFTEVVKVDKTGRRRKMRCLGVNNDSHTFVIGDSFVVTHNTITMLSLIRNDIKAGKNIVIIDMKRSPQLAAQLASWAKEHDRKFYHFVNGDVKDYDIPNSMGQCTYDPLINGGASKADMVLNMREYSTDAEVYKAAMRQLLQVLFPMLEQADRSLAPSIEWDQSEIRKIASAVNNSNMTELAAACEGQVIAPEAEAVEAQSRIRTSNLYRAVQELQSQMRTLIASAYGKWLKKDENIPNIDLYQLTKNDGEGNVILFSLNSDSEKDFSKYLGSLIVADLTAISALRRNVGHSNPVGIYLDEFQIIPPDAITGLLEKARASEMSVTLSSQSLEQIITASSLNGEAYLLSILDTCSNFIVHNGATEDSAIRLAKILGKHNVPTYSTTGDNDSFLFSFNFFNKRSQKVRTENKEEWKYSPEKFMTLESPSYGRSTAVIINKSPSDPRFAGAKGAVARTVWMVPEKCVLESYYDSEKAEKRRLESVKQAQAYEDKGSTINEAEDVNYGAYTGFDSYSDSDGDFGWSETDDLGGFDEGFIQDDDYTLTKLPTRTSEIVMNEKSVPFRPKVERPIISRKEVEQTFDTIFGGNNNNQNSTNRKRPLTLKEVLKQESQNAKEDGSNSDDLPDLSNLF